MEVRIDYIKKCLKAVSKDESRYYITGLFIHDKDGFRHYVGTNGHILVHCWEKLTEEPLDKGIIVKPLYPLGSKKMLKYGVLQIVDEKTAILNGGFEKRILCDIIDGPFPEYERVIPKDVKPENEYVCFNPEYLVLMKRILGTCTVRPLSTGVDEPHIFRGGDDENVEVILMPMRI